MAIVYVLLVAHFVGDFILQSDWMALNKSKESYALGVHVVVYTAALMFMVSMAITVGALTHITAPQYATWLVVNAFAHFVQDAVTSRLNARLWQANERHWFFVAIGFDQLLHYVTLFVTAGWWLQ